MDLPIDGNSSSKYCSHILSLPEQSKYLIIHAREKHRNNMGRPAALITTGGSDVLQSPLQRTLPKLVVLTFFSRELTTTGSR